MVAPKKLISNAGADRKLPGIAGGGRRFGTAGPQTQTALPDSAGDRRACARADSRAAADSAESGIGVLAFPASAAVSGGAVYVVAGLSRKSPPHFAAGHWACAFHNDYRGVAGSLAHWDAAIVSPPDAVAATAITERLRVPRRIVTILEGESLVNDATALVTYRFAVAAVLTGTFSLPQAALRFVIAAAGGIALGLLVGWIAGNIHKRLDDPPVQVTISLLTPFAAYLPADRLGLSGVLAVVVAGLYLGWRAPEIVTARMRLQSFPVWEMVVFLLNGVIFILIGLQLPEVVRHLSGQSIGRLSAQAALISVAVILIRILWVFPATYFPRMLSKTLRARAPYPHWKHVAIVAWTGMRGVVSLAAALALPLTLPNGAPFPGRDFILLFTFSVILATLVLQGLSLPPIIRWLNVVDDGLAEQEEREARLKANEAALARLNELSDRADPTALERLRGEYEDRIRQLEVCDPDSDSTKTHLYTDTYHKLLSEALAVERRTVIQLRNEQIINDAVLRRIQRDLDLAEGRLEREAR